LAVRDVAIGADARRGKVRIPVHIALFDPPRATAACASLLSPDGRCVAVKWRTKTRRCARMVVRAMHMDAGQVIRSGAVWNEGSGRSVKAQISACREPTQLSAPGTRACVHVEAADWDAVVFAKCSDTGASTEHPT
jgi:hypothetical protein